MSTNELAYHRLEKSFARQTRNRRKNVGHGFDQADGDIVAVNVETFVGTFAAWADDLVRLGGFRVQQTRGEDLRLAIVVRQGLHGVSWPSSSRADRG